MNLQESIRRIIKEVRVPRSERVELYKDDNIIVVVPLTHRALQKYAHQCQWCINDDIGQWEDYHKGKHAVIIQRKPKKGKKGITGMETYGEIFILSRLDDGMWDWKTATDILGYDFGGSKERALDYYVNISNDINNFATDIVYYSPENGIYDQEDNFLWNYNYEITDIPNVTPEVIQIMDDYLQENEEMNLQENISTQLRRRTHLLDRVIDNLLPNMYPCDYNSSDHFVEGVIDEIRWFLLDVEELKGIERMDIENYILDYKYNELTEYFNERCVVLKNDNLQENIIRILREESNYSNLSVNIGDVYEESEIYTYIQKLHYKRDYDFWEGDLGERIEKFPYYIVKEVPIENIEMDEYQLDEDDIEEYIEMFKERGSYPPIVLGNKSYGYYNIIDGTHRANALRELGFDKIICFVGKKNI